MADPKKTTTTEYKNNLAKQFIDSFEANTNNNYYLFAGNHLGGETIIQPEDTVRNKTIDVFRNMLFGKRITTSDVMLGIRRIDYTANTIYSMYDDDDDDLMEDDFYVVVEDGTTFYVYKCLENNNGGRSTVTPDYADVTDNEDVFYPNDGYRWKFMYSVNSAIEAKFATTDYFPVSENANVAADAVDGAIDVIKVTSAGKGYGNYTNGTFSTTDIKLGGNTVLYAISANASSSNGFYQGCYLYISSGAGAGQYKKISAYTVNATTKFVQLESEFTTTPQNNWQYEIYPAVNITGDGTQTINAAARAIINTTGNTIQRVEMLNRGAGYKYATANVFANAIVSVDIPAVVRPIYSPPGGHGYDAPLELGSKYVILYGKFANNEANTIVAENDYTQIGVIKNPLFANVNLSLNVHHGTFIVGETVKRINPLYLQGTANIQSGNTIVLIANADPSTLTANVRLYFNSGNNHQVANIVSSNTTAIVIDDSGLFSANAASYAIANSSCGGEVTATAAQSVTLTEVNYPYAVDDKVIGLTSGAYGTVNAVSITGQTKNFNTFIQMYTYEGTLVNSTFDEDETVYQGNVATANAKFYAAVGASTKKFYVTNQIGVFNTSNTIVGQDSGAIASISNKYNPDLVFGSGEVLFIENADAISRSNTQSETFKLILEY